MINTLSIIDNVDLGAIQGQLKSIRAFQAVVNQTLEKDQDYGVIAGTQKPTLLKGGAEKILMLLGISSDPVIIQQVEDWGKGIFAYTVKCNLYQNDLLVTAGLGSCNSKEDKYRYRWVYESDVPPGLDKTTLVTKKYGANVKYRIENDEIYTQINTLLKMAEKRALIDATLRVAALSNIFTQDMEDLKGFIEAERTETMTAGDASSVKFTWGKHKGKTIGDVLKDDPQYLEWVLKKDDADPYIKQAITKAMADDLDKLTGASQGHQTSKTSNPSTKGQKTSQRQQEAMPDDIFDSLEMSDEPTPF